MIELTEWFGSNGLPDRPWLVIGKGPTFERRDQFDLDRFNLVSLNHVVARQRVDVAHVIDADVVADVAEELPGNCRWLLMPRYPHLRSEPSPRPLEDWFDELPVLRRLDEEGRLVWYNLSGSAPAGTSPVVGAKAFSSEAVFGILGRMGVRTVRTLGIDGGRSYGNTFRDLEDRTLLANGMPAFDLQFERLRLIADEHGMEFAPLVEPLRIFVGTDDSQVVAYRVLEYTIRKHASIPVQVTPMLNLPHPLPKDAKNKPRTTFSYCRFLIPELCGYQGRALYLDADMLVFGDVAELADMPFGDKKVLCTAPERPASWDAHKGVNLGARSVAVMLLDCERLDWHIDRIVADLDAGRYTYEQLMSDVCVVGADEIADSIPDEWNHLERFVPGATRLLHYTVVPTQPWKVDGNPLAELWMEAYREAVEAGAVPPDEVDAAIARGLVKPTLAAALQRAPARRAVLTGPALDLATARVRIDELERRLESMRSSWSWRIGDAVVRTLRTPRRAAKKLAAQVRTAGR